MVDGSGSANSDTESGQLPVAQKQRPPVVGPRRRCSPRRFVADPHRRPPPGAPVPGVELPMLMVTTPPPLGKLAQAKMACPGYGQTEEGPGWLVRARMAFFWFFAIFCGYRPWGLSGAIFISLFFFQHLVEPCKNVCDPFFAGWPTISRKRPLLLLHGCKEKNESVGRCAHVHVHRS